MFRSHKGDPAAELRCSEELRHQYDHCHGPADELHDPPTVIAHHAAHPKDPAAELHRYWLAQDRDRVSLRSVVDYLRRRPTASF